MNILKLNDQIALASITREDLLGDMMYAGTLSYFAQTGKLIPQASSPKGAINTVHKALQGLHVRLVQLENDSASDRSHVLDRAEEFQGEVEANDAQVLEYFTQEREPLVAKNLPQVILQRHDDTSVET